MGRNAEKKEFFEETIRDNGIVQITLLSEFPGVDIPNYLKEEAVVRLNFSYMYNLPLFEFDSYVGIMAELSFQGKWEYCFVPWGAITKIVQMDGEKKGREWKGVGPEDIENISKDHEGTCMLKVPSEILSSQRAQRVLAMMSMQLARIGNNKVRFSLASLPKSAYTGLKLVVDNEEKPPPPSDLPPIAA